MGAVHPYLKSGGSISCKCQCSSHAHFGFRGAGVLGLIDQLDWPADSCVPLYPTAVHCSHPAPHVSVGVHVHRGQITLVGWSQYILKPKLQELLVLKPWRNNFHLPGVLGPLMDDALVLALLLVSLITCPLFITGLQGRNGGGRERGGMEEGTPRCNSLDCWSKGIVIERLSRWVHWSGSLLRCLQHDL